MFFQFSILNSKFFILILFFSILNSQFSIPGFAQHTNHEIGFSFAYAGQSPFITSNDDGGFFRQSVIWNLRYQVATNYLQSISVFLEHVGETRDRIALWGFDPEFPSGYNASISEHFDMTTLGLEGVRTIIRTDAFRLGFGFSLGYGFGGATATVTKIPSGSAQSLESCDTWTGLLVSAFFRGRYTLYQNSSADIGLTGSIRAWGFPVIGPLTECSMYNGPNLRTLFEIGYLAGISVGLK